MINKGPSIYQKNIQLERVRSCDHLYGMLEPNEVKLLLSNSSKLIYPLTSRNMSSDKYDGHRQCFQNIVAKQQLLMKKKLFDPLTYFGSGHFNSIEDSSKFNETKINIMLNQVKICDPFIKETLRFQYKHETKESSISKMSFKDQPGSPKMVKKSKLSNCSEINRNGIGKSPKNYLRQNKQNYYKMNINNMQKIRVKLKLAKK